MMYVKLSDGVLDLERVIRSRETRKEPGDLIVIYEEGRRERLRGEDAALVRRGLDILVAECRSRLTPKPLQGDVELRGQLTERPDEPGSTKPRGGLDSA